MRTLELKRQPPLRRHEVTLPPGSGLVIAGGLSALIWAIVAVVALH